MNNEQQCAYPTGHDGDPGLTKLEAFTMAAMQGLCAIQNKSDKVFSSEEEAADMLASMSVKIARATLSILQNEQK